MTARPCVCIVDAYSSGALLVAELRARGFASVHVQSENPIPAIAASSFVPDDHVANILYDGDFARCLAAVSQHHPAGIIAGCEIGVELAERLSEALGLPTNGTATLAARRNKHVMQTTIAEAGLRSVPSLLASEWATVERWLATLPSQRVVVKPPSSTATDNVHICREIAEARRGFDAIIGKQSAMARSVHTAAVVQQMIEGVEYMVDHASYAGNHVLLGVWRSEKLRGENPLYDRVVLLPADEPEHAALIAYARGVLDAVGARYGASHMELMIDERGPVLIEINCRLPGQKGPVLAARALEFSQVAATIDACIAPERLLTQYPQPYRLANHAARVQLISHKAGRVVALPHLDDVRALPSFFQMQLGVAVGKDVARTVDMRTMPGYIDLVHSDASVLEADYRRIREWEAQDFYRVERG